MYPNNTSRSSTSFLIALKDRRMLFALPLHARSASLYDLLVPTHLLLSSIIWYSKITESITASAVPLRHTQLAASTANLLRSTLIYWLPSLTAFASLINSPSLYTSRKALMPIWHFSAVNNFSRSDIADAFFKLILPISIAISFSDMSVSSFTLFARKP